MLSRSRPTTSIRTRVGKKPLRDRHIVDEALAYMAALSKNISSPAELRRRRKTLRETFGSKGRISVLEQFSEILSGLSELEIEVYRSPHITWRLVQRIVRRDTPTATIIRALREAVAVPPIDRRRRRVRRGTRPKMGVTDVSTFDPELARSDPSAYLTSALEAWLRQIAFPLRALITEDLATQARAGGINDVGQSLTLLMSTLARQRTSARNPVLATPEQDLSLRMIKRLEEIQRILVMAARPAE